MKVYYVSLENQAFKHPELMPKIGILVSYYKIRKLPEFPFCDSMFLDSGAFSVYTQGGEIDIEEYMDFIREHEDQLDVYAALDVIGDAKKSIRNYYKMLGAGLKPLPAVHRGEPMWVLETYAETTNYIGLGGSATPGARSRGARAASMDRIFGEYGHLDYHGYGIQQQSIMERYPWRSVDGQFAHYAARLGGIRSPWGAFVIGDDAAPKHRIQDKYKLKPRLIQRIREWIEDELGISWKGACASTPEGTELRLIINARFLEEYVTHINRRQYRHPQAGLGFNVDGLIPSGRKTMRRTK